MPVFPYKRTPSPPDVAVLVDEAQVIDEHGELQSLDRLPDDVKVWGSYDVVHRLVRDGLGEALCWNGDEIRWRHRRFEDGWKRRRSDVAVLRVPLPVEPERAVRAVARWRDWLARYGAAPSSTTGSAAWSLLRARIDRPLWLSWGSCPPLVQTLGGRQQLGPAGRGQFRGELALHDMPAAYAQTLAHLPYGGRWYTGTELGSYDPEWWSRGDRPVFARCTVKLCGDSTFGPLPRRSRRRLDYQEAILLTQYPTSGKLKGVWCWPELRAAVDSGGASIVKVHEWWVHIAPERPFESWWEAIEQGRTMPGVAGVLAKVTGNALWGQFCMDPRGGGVRTIHGRLEAGKRAPGRELVARPVESFGGRPPAHDLAETVSGRVRARLYEAIESMGDRVLSAHTDGVWHYDDAEPPDGWRRDEEAKRLDLLGPQTLRYWPRRGEPRTVVSGVPSELAAEQFNEWWSEIIERGEVAA